MPNPQNILPPFKVGGINPPRGYPKGQPWSIRRCIKAELAKKVVNEATIEELKGRYNLDFTGKRNADVVAFAMVGLAQRGSVQAAKLLTDLTEIPLPQLVGTVDVTPRAPALNLDALAPEKLAQLTALLLEAQQAQTTLALDDPTVSDAIPVERSQPEDAKAAQGETNATQAISGVGSEAEKAATGQQMSFLDE